ncbi:hypothetical protein [Actinoallomurus sp. NPDC052274]|uniref:hypothetical protein n=1 Tax=Actinoallomurus sp. NPDC052274 TaxID=3155420 RepID=UPI00341D7C8B
MRRTVPGRLIAFFGVVMFVSLAASVRTGAAASVRQEIPAMGLATDHNKIGNGEGNVSVVSIRSPANLSGVQNVADANAATRVSRNSAICKKHRLCRIRQRAYVAP